MREVVPQALESFKGSLPCLGAYTAYTPNLQGGRGLWGCTGCIETTAVCKSTLRIDHSAHEASTNRCFKTRSKNWGMDWGWLKAILTYCYTPIGGVTDYHSENPVKCTLIRERAQRNTHTYGAHNTILSHIPTTHDGVVWLAAHTTLTARGVSNASPRSPPRLLHSDKSPRPQEDGRSSYKEDSVLQGRICR